ADATAARRPFPSPELVAGLGETPVVYGTNAHSNGLVAWDRFCGGLDNHNSVILARSGAGKSYLAKLEVLRSLAVGGTVLHLGTEEGRSNPFALPPTDVDGQTVTDR